MPMYYLVIKGNIVTEQGFEEFRQNLKRRPSKTVIARLAAGGAEGVIATILYE